MAFEVKLNGGDITSDLQNDKGLRKMICLSHQKWLVTKQIMVNVLELITKFFRSHGRCARSSSFSPTDVLIPFPLQIYRHMSTQSKGMTSQHSFFALSNQKLDTLECIFLIPT